MLLSDLSVKRPVFATVISLLLVAFGAISFSRLSVRELPDVDPPVVSVRTSYPGANAAVVENQITQVLEGSIAGVSGIETIDSSSSDGSSNITIQFRLDRDIDAAANDVRDKISRILDRLPEEVDPPEISKADSDASPVIWFNLISPVMSTEQLTDFAERNIVDRMSVVDGVSSVRIGGSKRYAIRVNLDRKAMAARNVTVEDIESALRRENVELPAGTVESINRDTIVRINREYRRPEEFAQLVIRKGNDDGFVRLGDVAEVVLGVNRTQALFRANGQSLVGIGIIKQSKSNTLAVAEGAKREAARIQESLPESMELLVAFDTSVFIDRAIEEVYYTLAISMGLVVLVLYLFLGNIKTVLVPAVTVPVCIVASFTVMALAGVTINLITLLALVLAIGLVVDDAIVVLENIYRRVEEGEPGLLAAYRGARQVGFAVIATTLVLIAVFMPVLFLTSNVGRIFGELAITMAAAVAFSSLVALTLSPMMCSLLVRRRSKKPWFSKKLDHAFEGLQNTYRKLLQACLDNKIWVTLSFMTCFVLIAALLPRIPEELAPIEDRSNLFMIIRGPEGASHEYMAEQALKAEEQILPMLETGELVRFIMRIDGNGGFGFLILAPWEERTRSEEEIAFELTRKLSANVPGARMIPLRTSGLSRRGGGGQDVQFVIAGQTYEQLGEYAEAFLAAIGDYPGLQNVDVDYKPNQPQFDVKIDIARAADIGVSIQSVGRTLETMMGGRNVTRFEDNGEQYDVILQALEGDRQSPGDMTNIYVRGRSGELVALSNLASVSETAGAGSLRRFNRVRALTVSGSLAEGYTQGEVLDYLEAKVREVLPDAAGIDYKGTTREYKEAGGDIYFIFALALIVVFLVLAAQFESFLHPLVIMLTVPLAILGGLVGLYLSDSTMNIYSQLGMIMLIGLAAKNGILIVEFANQLRDEGKDIRTALMDASITRLRPIMMTGLSTAMGAVPLMIATGAGSASRQTIGVVVFGGVLIATFFTLFIVPVFYDMLARYTRSPGHVASQLAVFEEEIEDKEAPAAHHAE